MFRSKIIVAGAGGQGALRVGQMIAYAALSEGNETTWLPSYGAEMRGGTANCNVIISDEEIPFVMVDQADYLIIMNNASLEKFESIGYPNSTLILNSSMVDRPTTRTDLKVYQIPADLIAEEEGNTRGANMVLLGAYVAASGNIALNTVNEYIDRSFVGSKAKYADANKRLVKRGYDLVLAEQN